MNWGEFFAMGGYAFYVWSSYGAVALVLILNVYLPLQRRRRVERRVREFIRLKGQQS